MDAVVVPIRTDVLAHETLLRRTGDDDVLLLVVGFRARRLLQSPLRALTAAAPVPVVVVPPALMSDVHRKRRRLRRRRNPSHVTHGRRGALQFTTRDDGTLKFAGSSRELKEQMTRADEITLGQGRPSRSSVPSLPTPSEARARSKWALSLIAASRCSSHHAGMPRRHRHVLRLVLATLAGMGGAGALIVGLPPGFGWGLVLIAIGLAAAPMPRGRPARSTAPAHRRARSRTSRHAVRVHRSATARQRHR